MNLVSQLSKETLFLYFSHNIFFIFRHNDNNFEAKLTINFKLYKVSYDSIVNIDQNANSYKIVSKIDKTNPIFDRLISKWQINHIDENLCEMKYEVELKFRNFLYQQLTQYFIDIVGDKMSNAFEKRLYDENLRKNKILLNKNNDEKNIESKKKSTILQTHSEILENLIAQINSFYELHKITDGEFLIIMEIINENLDLKEFLIQAYILFCKNNLKYKDGEYKLLHYLKDISLMKRIKT